MNALFEKRKNLLAAAAASGALYAANQFVMMKILEPLGGEAMMRFQLMFSEKGMADLLWDWGPAGIETFRSHFYFDFYHPLLYGAFLFFSMLYIRTGLSGPLREGGFPKYCFLPLAAGAFDIIENIMEIVLVGQYPDLSAALVFSTATVSLLKWVLAGLSIAIVLVTGARLLTRKLADGKKAG